MEIARLQQEVDHWIKTVGIRYFNELTNTAILNEEVGELSRLMARIYGEQSFKKEVSKEDQQIMLADEMADILWVLVCLANQTGVNLTKAIDDNLKKKNVRDIDRHKNNPKLL